MLGGEIATNGELESWAGEIGTNGQWVTFRGESFAPAHDGLVEPRTIRSSCCASVRGELVEPRTIRYSAEYAHRPCETVAALTSPRATAPAAAATCAARPEA